ncbi:MAG: hypothetical protein EAZ06_10165 [Cytophagales bacterium]|nr:MAG: hypothetical protein EAZ06_10165 [Cytophagales bacterium]
MENSSYQNYLEDTFYLLLEKLECITKDLSSCSEDDKKFLLGQQMGIFDSLSLIQMQASIFDISIQALDNVNLYKYLIPINNEIRII